MKQIDIKLPTLALSLAIGCTSLWAAGPGFGPSAQTSMGRLGNTPVNHRQFRGEKPFDVNSFDTRPGAPGAKRSAGAITPDMEFTGLPQYDYLEGPDGSTWFYTAEFEYEDRELGPDYFEPCISAFTFTIYDNLFNEVGRVHDIVRYLDGETRAVSVTLDPAVTTRFFNSDSNPEVMVMYAMNTLSFTNHYYYGVYSVGGERDADGNDVRLMTQEGLCVDAVNAAAPGGEENFYITFQSPAHADLDADYDGYIDYLNALTYTLDTYGKAADGEFPKLLFSKDIYCARIPGDTTNGIYLITKPLGGKVYFIYSQYEKPFFVDPTGMASDESATPDNSLIIEAYLFDGADISEVGRTQVKVNPVVEEGALYYTYLSIGSVSWKDDVDMTVNGTPASPAYVVAVDVQNAALYDELVSSGYYVYGSDGRLVKTVATETGGIMVFRTPEGEEPEVMFVRPLTESTYQFDFVGLYSGELRFSIDQANGGDPISARCDRVPQPDGSYKYAFEMTYYTRDADDNEQIRVAWYDATGRKERIDAVNIGKDVMAAMVNMAASVLSPTVFDDDEAMEYAVLVKRSYGQTIRNEFAIVDDNGENFITFTEDDGKGLPYTLTVLTGEADRLMMVYDNDFRYTIDLYDLPFEVKAGSGVEAVETETGEGVYYDLQGRRVDSPEKGVYVRVNGSKASKVVVK